MKKLLLGTAAIALGLAFAAPAANAADGVKLGIGGYFKGYGSWLDQDTTPDDATTPSTDESQPVRDFEIIRDTEVHFTGESTLDNGLTVGFNTELEDDQNDGFGVQESYAYFSGAWGRVNFGAEDGAAYLLQVAAPSADSNIDGVRQNVQPVNYSVMTGPAPGLPADNVTFDELFSTGSVLDGMVVDVDSDNAASINDVMVGANGAGVVASTRFDYDQAITGFNDKVTYMTPVFNGFQGGVSFTPNLDGDSIDGINDTGHTTDTDVGEWSDAWEMAVRYEGQWNAIGVTLGAGWSHAALEDAGVNPLGDNADPVLYREDDGVVGFTGTDEILATLDDQEAWNVGADINWSAFGLGFAYTEDNNGVTGSNAESQTWVVGIDYTTGPFKVGGSYYDRSQDVSSASVDTTRWTGGAIYTYGPGMTFRGSISFLDYEEDFGAASDDAEATSVVLGTQIDF